MIKELLQLLLPNQEGIRLEQWDFDHINHQVLLTVASIQSVVPCPLCAQTTHRIHSHYERTLKDLRWADYNVKWQLQVRKFFCLNPSCKRRIFTERLPAVTAPNSETDVPSVRTVKCNWVSPRWSVSEFD